MKANRAARARSDDAAGAEVVGALLLFAIFVGAIALLNVTAVPNAGLAAEEEHHENVLAALNGLQADAESADDVGASVARSIELSPSRSVGQDFFSFFLAAPARASGELVFDPDQGNLSVLHHHQGPNAIYDLGSPSEALTLGRLTFDPHPVFRGEGAVDLENGGAIASAAGASTMRFDPPVAVSVAGATTHVTILARVLNGTAASLGGSAPVRIALMTEAATLTSPASNNARDVTMRLETDHGEAWGGFLNDTSEAAGLAQGSEYYVGVERGAPDVVTWIVNGTAASGNDVRLTTGIAIHRVTLS